MNVIRTIANFLTSFNNFIGSVRVLRCVRRSSQTSRFESDRPRNRTAAKNQHNLQIGGGWLAPARSPPSRAALAAAAAAAAQTRYSSMGRLCEQMWLLMPGPGSAKSSISFIRVIPVVRNSATFVSSLFPRMSVSYVSTSHPLFPTFASTRFQANQSRSICWIVRSFVRSFVRSHPLRVSLSCRPAQSRTRPWSLKTDRRRVELSHTTDFKSEKCVLPLSLSHLSSHSLSLSL